MIMVLPFLIALVAILCILHDWPKAGLWAWVLLMGVYSHFFGKNPRLQAGKTSVLAHVKIPACLNIGPP